MESDQADRVHDAAEGRARRALLGAVRKPLLVMMRQLRAAKQTERAVLEPLVEQAHTLLTELLDQMGVLEIGLAAEALTFDGERVAEYSPHDDVIVFRLFQFGVRKLLFHPGLSRDELVQLFEVLTQDFTQDENIEDDITTMLASRDFEAIQFVVIETFFEEAERTDDEQRDRLAHVQDLIAQATQASLAFDDGAHAGVGASTSGGAVTVWAADAEVLASGELPGLLAALPRIGVSDGEVQLEDPELLGLGEELKAELEQTVARLPEVALALLDRVEGADAERVCNLLAREIGAEAKRCGLTFVAEAIDAVDDWLLSHPRDAVRATLERAVFTPQLRGLALRSLARDDASYHVALRVLAQTPADQVTTALRGVARLRDPETRRAAFAAMFDRGDAVVEAACVLLRDEGDPALAADILEPLRWFPSGLGTVSAFRCALTYGEAEVRLRGLSWMAFHGGDRAVKVLGESLRDPDARVRASALLLLAETRRHVAPSLLKVWIASDEIERLPYVERRRAVLVLAQAAGEASLPLLQELAHQKNILSRPRADEERAMGLAGLGQLADPDALSLAEKLVGSSHATLAQEAAHVRHALEAGELPYGDALAELYTELREAGLLTALLTSDPPRRSSLGSLRPSAAPRRRTQRTPAFDGLPVSAPRPAPLPADLLTDSASYGLPPTTPPPPRPAGEGEVISPELAFTDSSPTLDFPRRPSTPPSSTRERIRAGLLPGATPTEPFARPPLPGDAADAKAVGRESGDHRTPTKEELDAMLAEFSFDVDEGGRKRRRDE